MWKILHFFFSHNYTNFYLLPLVIIILNTTIKGIDNIVWEGFTGTSGTTFPGGQLGLVLSVSDADIAVDAIIATFKGDRKNIGSSVNIGELKPNTIQVKGNFYSIDTTVTTSQKFFV